MYKRDLLWPVHLKPKNDELLSSWLVRLARAHGLKLHTFCSLTWPGKQIWNRDIDKSADTEIAQLLSDKTGTSVQGVRATMLATYESILYERHNHFGPISWIMPIGVYHRTRRKCGLQFCPRCLAEDEEPYYRRRWRLAFMVICERHRTVLHDRCPKCGAAINFHRDELGNHRKFVAVSLTLCHACRFDLRGTVDNPLAPTITTPEVGFSAMLLQAMKAGYVQVGESVTTYSHLYFTVLRQLMRIIAMRNKRIEELKQSIGRTYGVEIYVPPALRPHPDVQELGVEARRQLLGIVRCLLEEWPYRFIELSQRHKVWSSIWLSHLESGAWERAQIAPFWFWSVVHDHLYRARYRPSDKEINSVVEYLQKDGSAINKSAIARLLGVAVVRQEDI